MDGNRLRTKGALMKPQNAAIYHCLICGRVVHHQPNLETPTCCGYEMARATTESAHIRECTWDIPDQTGKVPSKTVPPVIKAQSQSTV